MLFGICYFFGNRHCFKFRVSSLQTNLHRSESDAKLETKRFQRAWLAEQWRCNGDATTMTAATNNTFVSLALSTPSAILSQRAQNHGDNNSGVPESDSHAQLKPSGAVVSPSDDAIKHDERPGQIVDQRTRITRIDLTQLAVGVVGSLPLLVFLILRIVRVPVAMWATWLELAISTPVFFFTGYGFHVRGVKSWINRCPPQLDMFTLVNLSTTVAYAYSLIVVFWPSTALGESFRDEYGALLLYFDFVGVAITIALAGQLIGVVVAGDDDDANSDNKLSTAVTTNGVSDVSVQQWLHKMAAIFTPLVIGVAAVTFAVWLALAGKQDAVSRAIVNTVVVLMVGGPSAIGLATPLAVAIAIKRGAVTRAFANNSAVAVALVAAVSVAALALWLFLERR